jgi:hypothetical protein
MIILKWSLKEQGVRVWTGFIWLRIFPVPESWKNGNEASEGR